MIRQDEMNDKRLILLIPIPKFYIWYSYRYRDFALWWLVWRTGLIWLHQEMDFFICPVNLVNFLYLKYWTARHSFSCSCLRTKHSVVAVFLQVLPHNWLFGLCLVLWAGQEAAKEDRIYFFHWEGNQEFSDCSWIDAFKLQWGWWPVHVRNLI